MSILQPLIAIIGESIAKTIDKLNFNKNKIKPTQLIFLIFSGMFIGLISFILITQESFPILDIKLVSLILLMIIFSLAQNIFDFTGISSKNLSFREPINNFEPIMASFIAFILFPSEREIKIIVAIIIGAIVLYLGNSDKKLDLKLDKGTICLFLAMICSAILVSIYKFGLEFISPSYLFIFRVSGILLILPLLKKINFKELSTTQISYGLFSGFIYFGGFIFRLFSIKNLGLNFTILILLLGPALTYFLSKIILKEKIQFKKIVISFILILIIVLAIYI